MTNLSEQEIALFNYSDILTENPIYLRNSWNENTPPHQHFHIEFFYVLDGSGIHIFNKTEKILTHGNAYLLTLKDIHEFQIIENKNFQHMDICIDEAYFKSVCDFFSPTLYQDLFSQHGYAFTLSAKEMLKIENCIPNLLLNPRDASYHLAAKVLSTILINLAIEHNSEQLPSPPSWLVQLLAALGSYDNFRCSLSSIVARFDYNEDYVRRLFKKFFGTTMTDYFNQQKINYAFNLLSTTKLSTETICEITGFNNISYFYRLFHKTFNTTPGNIRKLL